VKLSVKIDGLDATKARLRGLSEKKIRVAAVAALNSAAFKAAKATQDEMSKVFDRPTPWVIGGVRYRKANKDTLTASVDFERWGNKAGVSVDKVLNAQITGGQRRHKRHEVALSRVGILPPGFAIVPGVGAEIDAYGNMAASQIRQILSFFQAAQMTSGYSGNMTQRRKDALAKGNKRTGAVGFEYFVVQPGQRRQFQRSNGKTGTHKMQPGIYQRFYLAHGTAIKPVMIFVRMPAYKKILDFYGLAERVAMAEFNQYYPRYLNQLFEERGL